VPTQLEHLSDASILGKLLVFPANVRLDWKVIASTNALAFLASLTVMKENCFITLIPGSSWQARQTCKVSKTDSNKVVYLESLLLAMTNERRMDCTAYKNNLNRLSNATSNFLAYFRSKYIF
jgi:hypothetical protein